MSLPHGLTGKDIQENNGWAPKSWKYTFRGPPIY